MTLCSDCDLWPNHNQSMNMYNATASYAQSLMPPESILSTLAPIVEAPLSNLIGNADPYAGTNFQRLAYYEIRKGSLLRRPLLVGRIMLQKHKQ